MGEGNIRIELRIDFNELIEWHMKIIIINKQLYKMFQYVYTMAGETYNM